ncbi:hypothetical protein ACIBO1_12755 [Micromonospora sp. NPDC049903]|uniref:hypothetical protein n=1 Tax=Micromonospora sp. NPDC049903 TaxID=3364276 RepID=UPI0037A7B1E8
MPTDTPSPAAVADALTEAFTHHNVRPIQDLLSRTGHAHALADLDALFTGRAPDSEIVRAVLRAQVGHVAGRPDLLLLLVSYLYARINEMWDLYADQGGVLRTITEVLRTGFPESPEQSRGAGSGPPSTAITEHTSIMLENIRLVSQGMAVSRAVNSSCMDEVEKQAGRIVAAMDDQICRIRSIRDGGELTDWLSAHANETRDYYQTLVSCARATRQFLLAGKRAGDQGVHEPREVLAEELAGFLEKVEQTRRRHPARAWLSGDLAALAANLRIMREWVNRDFLFVEDATVVYIYPFAIPSAVLDRVRLTPGRDGSSASTGYGADPISAIRSRCEERALRVHGRPISAVVDHAVGDDWGAESDYRVLDVSLPPVLITMTDAARTQTTLIATLRISSLGNHSLRIEGALVDADVHLVNQALRRPSVVMGASEKVRLATSDRTEAWSRLSEYAQEVITEFLNGLNDDPSADQSFDDVAQRAAATAVALSHSLLVVHSLQVIQADGTARHACGSEIRDAAIVGSSLFVSPVGRDAVTLEEWVRYRPSPHVTDILGDYGYDGDIVLRTANTTVVSAPETPDWMALSYSAQAEFIATLPGVLLGWTAEITEYIRQARDQLDTARRLLQEAPMSTVQERSALQYTILSLEQRYADLRLVTSDVRAKLNGINSPTLLRDLIRRSYFDRLYEAAGLAAYERSLLSRIQEAEDLYQVASGLFRAFDDRLAAAESHRRRRLNTILTTSATLLAIASTAELYGLLNDLIEPRPWVLAVEVTSIGVFALIMVVVLVLVGRQPRGRDARRPWRAWSGGVGPAA